MTDPAIPASAQDNPYATPEHQPEAQRKVYSLAQVLWGTFIAGVFVTAFMARANHLAFGQPARAIITFWTFFGIGLLLITTEFILPTTSVLIDIVIYAITTITAGIWYHLTMRRSFDDYTKTAGRRASHWQAVGVILMCIIGLVAFAALVFAVCEFAGIELPE